MRRRGRLIVVSGVDGAGKSTQIERLAARLRRCGLEPIVSWHRPGYSPELDALRRMVRRFRRGALPPPGPSRARERAFSRPGVRRAWVAVALVDTAAQHLLKVRAHLAAGRVVICDRGLEDARLDLSLRFPELEPLLGRTFPLLRRLAPRPDLELMLLVSSEEATRRSEAKGEPFPDPPEVREARARAYRRLADTGRCDVVDAGGRIEQVEAQIWERVATVLDCPSGEG